MKAMILAAGRGTRVRPLTETLPKPMVPIVHKPVMEMLVEHLRNHGFGQIMVNTSYLAPQIENYFRDGHQFGVRMAYSFEGTIKDGGIGAFSGKEENPYDRVLADLRSAHAETRNKRFEAESQLKAFESNGETDIKTRSVQEAVLIDPGLSNLKANLFKRRADLLTQLSGLQPAHPVHAEVTEELRRIDSELNSQTSKLKDQIQKSVQARYRTGVDQSRRVEADINGELEALVKKGANFSGLYNQAMTLTYDIDQQRKELDTVRERLNHFAAEQNSFGFVRLVTPALPPEMPYGLGKKKILLAAFGAALLLMLAVPVAIDLMDRRIHTVNDAEKVMGIPALGWMVERSNDATKLFGDNLLRRLAGGLINEQQRQGTRVFAFSSVKPAGGASELVLSLGKTLDALGYPKANVWERLRSHPKPAVPVIRQEPPHAGCPWR